MMEEKDFVDKVKAYDIVPRSEAAMKGAEFFAPGGSLRTRVRMTNHQLRARWVAHEFRGQGGDKHEYFSENI